MGNRKGILPPDRTGNEQAGKSPPTATFFYDLQQQRLSPAQVQVTPRNLGTTQSLQWTVVPSGSWFSVSPLSGATPSPFTITPENFNAQTPAVYTGLVSVTVTDPPGTAGSPVQIPLTLHVVERLYPTFFPLIIR